MSSIPSISSYGQLLIHTSPMPIESRIGPASSNALRRRPTRNQGLALEALGHAIEYIYDSQVYRNNGNLSPSDVEAVQLLMRLSREVYMECREVVPSGRGIHRGIRYWVLRLWPEHRAA